MLAIAMGGISNSAFKLNRTLKDGWEPVQPATAAGRDEGLSAIWRRQTHALLFPLFLEIRIAFQRSALCYSE